MPKEVQVDRARFVETNGTVVSLFGIRCPDPQCTRAPGEPWVVWDEIPLQDATPERVAQIESQLRRIYLDHRGRQH